MAIITFFINTQGITLKNISLNIGQVNADL